MNFNKCENCPAKELSWACPAKTRPHPRFCELATNPRYAQVIIRECEKDKIDIAVDNTPTQQSDNTKLNYQLGKCNISLVFSRWDTQKLDILRTISNDYINVIGVGAGTESDLPDTELPRLAGVAALRYSNVADMIVFDDELLRFFDVETSTPSINLSNDINRCKNARYYYTKDLDVRKLQKYIIKEAYSLNILKKPPSLARRALNFGMAVLQYTEDLLTEGVDANVSNETYSFRVMSCYGCDRLDRARGICTECGCYIKLKARMTSQECPVGKWGKGETTDADRQAVTNKGCGCGK